MRISFSRTAHGAEDILAVVHKEIEHWDEVAKQKFRGHDYAPLMHARIEDNQHDYTLVTPPLFDTAGNDFTMLQAKVQYACGMIDVLFADEPVKIDNGTWLIRHDAQAWLLAQCETQPKSLIKRYRDRHGGSPRRAVHAGAGDCPTGGG